MSFYPRYLLYCFFSPQYFHGLLSVVTGTQIAMIEGMIPNNMFFGQYLIHQSGMFICISPDTEKYRTDIIGIQKL